MYILYMLYSYGCAEQLSYGSKVLDKLGCCHNNFQKHPRGGSFYKNDLLLDGPRGYFRDLISGLIFFLPNTF